MTGARTAIDIVAARRILDEDHFGLEKIKRRIIEYLAVRKLAPNGTAPIMCFVGPPGVGKTSFGQSIARAMNRKFVRVSLGGVRICSDGEKARHGMSRSWTTTRDDAMSIKREDLDAGRIDFADTTTGKRLTLIHPGRLCATISCSR